MNKVFLSGKVMGEPIIKDGQSRFATLALVTVKPEYVSANGDVRPARESIHRVMVFSRMVDFVAQNVHAESRIMIEGEISYSSFVDSFGATMNRTDIFCQNIELI